MCAVGNSLPIWTVSKSSVVCLSALLSSHVCDFAARFKVGGTNFNFFIVEQLPVIPPYIFTTECNWANTQIDSWLLPRIVELTYTAHDLAPFAKDCGYDGPPFRWDEARRFLLRCELDAAFFHLYLPSNQDGTWKKVEADSTCKCNTLKVE